MTPDQPKRTSDERIDAIAMNLERFSLELQAGCATVNRRESLASSLRSYSA